MCKFISRGRGHTGPFTWRPEYNLRCCSTGTNYYFFQVTICHRPVAFQVGEAGWCSALGICLFLPPQFYGFRCVPPHRPWGSNFMFRTCKPALCWLSHPLNPCLFIYLFIKIYFIYIGCVTVCLRVCMCTMCRPGVCRGQKRVLDLLELEFINLGTKFKFSGRAENAPRHCAFSVLCSCHTIILIYF